MVVDLDAHQGNGTAAVFQEWPWASILDVYQESLFPSVKEREDYAIPLSAGTTGGAYLDIIRDFLPGALDDVRPDLIHSHFVSTTLVARLALGRDHATPRLFQVAGPLHLEHPTFRALDLATAGPRDGWIATCRWTADAYRRLGIPPSRVWCSGCSSCPLRSWGS